MPAGHCCEHPGAGPHSLGIHTRACWARCEHLGAGWPRNAIPQCRPWGAHHSRLTKSYTPGTECACSPSAQLLLSSRSRPPKPPTQFAPLVRSLCRQGEGGWGKQKAATNRPPTSAAELQRIAAWRGGWPQCNNAVIERVITAYTLQGRARSTLQGHTSVLINLKVR